MDFEAKNKIVLVTGASSGIGKAVAEAFAKKGAKVALTARNVEVLKTVRNNINEDGGTSEIFPFDLEDISGIPQLVDDVERHFGDSVDILVNSAGIAVLGFVDDVPVKAYSHNLQINFFAPLALIKAVLPGMKKKKGGQIISISSGVGKRGLPGVSSYCLSKSALNALTESVRVELAPYGIDVILFSPGLVATGFSDKIKIYGNLEEKFTGGNMSSPEEIAEKILHASVHAKKEVMLSFRTRIGYHLNYWAPRLFDYILKRRLLASGQWTDFK